MKFLCNQIKSLNYMKFHINIAHVLFFMPTITRQKWAKILPFLSRCIYEKLEKNTSFVDGTTQKNECPFLCKGLSNSRENSAVSLPALRNKKSRNAPRGLCQANGSRLVVSAVSSARTQHRRKNKTSSPRFNGRAITKEPTRFNHRPRALAQRLVS